MYAALGVGFAVQGWGGVVPDALQYRCWLTGAANGLPSVLLPLSGFYARMYSGAPSAFQVSICYTPEIYAAVQARPAGALTVERICARAGVVLGAQAVFSMPNGQRQFHHGPFRQTLVISGERQTTNTTPQTVPVTAVAATGLDFNGGRTWEVPADTWVRPGDSILVAGETVLIDRVQLETDADRVTVTLRAKI